MESKVVLKASTRLYIDALFATIIEKVSNLQRFVSHVEINTFRLLRTSGFILTRNSCISLLFNYYGETRSQDRTNQISGKVHAYLSNSSMCRKSNLYVTK